jgi:hypothetical protein
MQFAGYVGYILNFEKIGVVMHNVATAGSESHSQSIPEKQVTVTLDEALDIFGDHMILPSEAIRYLSLEDSVEKSLLESLYIPFSRETLQAHRKNERALWFLLPPPLVPFSVFFNQCAKDVTLSDIPDLNAIISHRDTKLSNSYLLMNMTPKYKGSLIADALNRIAEEFGPGYGRATPYFAGWAYTLVGSHDCDHNHQIGGFYYKDAVLSFSLPCTDKKRIKFISEDALHDRCKNNSNLASYVVRFKV